MMWSTFKTKIFGGKNFGEKLFSPKFFPPKIFPAENSFPNFLSSFILLGQNHGVKNFGGKKFRRRSQFQRNKFRRRFWPKLFPAEIGGHSFGQKIKKKNKLAKTVPTTWTKMPGTKLFEV